MVDSKLIYKHSQTQKEITELEIQDEKRKSLIRLAVLRIITLFNEESTTKRTEMEESVTKNHEYEVMVDKIKQDYSTKEKLQAAKIETMKEEISKLKSQLKAQISTPSGTSSIYSSSSQWLRNQNSFHSSALNSRLRMRYNDAITRSVSSPAYPVNFQNTSENSSLILTPLKKKSLIIPRTKREYTNYNTLKKRHEENRSNSEEPELSSLTTPTKDPQNHSVIRRESINKQKNSMSTEDKLVSEIDPPLASGSRNTSMISATDDDTFASANSSLGSVKSLDSAKSEKRKKKLKLWKSEATRVTLGSEARESDIVDEDNLNSATYYQDANFQADSSPPKRLHKRKSDDITPDPTNIKRKKKNVFKIN